MQWIKKTLGQLSLATALIGAVGVLGASFFTARATTDSKLYSVQQQISIIEERESNHYRELAKRLDSIEIKLDKLLEQRLIIKK